MRRILSIGPVTEAAVRIIQGQLQEDLLSNVLRHVGSDQDARMANIINKLDRNHMEGVMQSLAAARPKTAEVCKLMFTFDDIVKRIVDTELASGGPALQRDVLKARRTIADTALELASGGEIELNSSQDEDEFFD